MTRVPFDPETRFALPALLPLVAGPVSQSSRRFTCRHMQQHGISDGMRQDDGRTLTFMILICFASPASAMPLFSEKRPAVAAATIEVEVAIRTGDGQ